MITTRRSVGHVPRTRAALSLALLALLALLAGCGDGDRDPGNPVRPGTGSPSSQFTGTFLSGFEAGLLSVSIPTAPLAPGLRAASLTDTVVTAIGVMSVDGGEVVNLAGSYDAATDSIHMVGGAWTLAGSYDSASSPPVLVGTISGANGAARFACFPGNTSSVHVFCGRFESDVTPLEGRWNVMISGSALGGLMAPDGAASVTGFSGSVSGGGLVRSLTFSSGAPESQLSGTGDWNTSSGWVGGSWTTGGDSGTWAGEPCLPGGGGPN